MLNVWSKQTFESFSSGGTEAYSLYSTNPWPISYKCALLSIQIPTAISLKKLSHILTKECT